MSENVDPSELWTTQEPLTIKNEEYWMKLRVMEDRRTKQKYYDILAGKKDREAHLHYGFNLLGYPIFQLPRDQVEKIRRETDSQLHGRISDESKILRESREGEIDFVFRVIVKGSTRESRVSRFEFKPAGSKSPPPDISM